jgi:hypothetical protein
MSINKDIEAAGEAFWGLAGEGGKVQGKEVRIQMGVNVMFFLFERGTFVSE